MGLGHGLSIDKQDTLLNFVPSKRLILSVAPFSGGGMPPSSAHSESSLLSQTHMADIEAQGGGYKDDPEFDSLSDHIADQLFQISATNGRIWSMLRTNQREGAVELATDTRWKFRELRDSLERLQQWEEPEPSQQFSQHRIAREFSGALSEFQRIQKRLAEVEKEDLHAAMVPQGNSSAIELPHATHPEDEEPPQESSAEQLQSQAFEEQLRQDEVAYQRGLVMEREQEIQGIEDGINELNGIFSNLSTIVTEQGTVLDNIESNIYSVASATRDGSHQLTKAVRWQRRSSGRQLCFLLILLVIALVISISIWI